MHRAFIAVSILLLQPLTSFRLPIFFRYPLTSIIDNLIFQSVKQFHLTYSLLPKNELYSDIEVLVYLSDVLCKAKFHIKIYLL